MIQKSLMHAIMNFRYNEYNLAKIKVSKTMSMAYPVWNEIDKVNQEHILKKLNNLVNEDNLIHMKLRIRNQLAYDLTKQTMNNNNIDINNEMEPEIVFHLPC